MQSTALCGGNAALRREKGDRRAAGHPVSRLIFPLLGR
jgi:hypothetical protein